MTQELFNLSDVSEALAKLGYAATVTGDSVALMLGGDGKPAGAVLTMSEQRGELDVTCQIAKLRDIRDAHMQDFLVACLDANYRIRPYAFAVISASSGSEEIDDPEEWPVVLTDSLPLGDLSTEEIRCSMSSLQMALATARSIMSHFAT